MNMRKWHIFSPQHCFFDMFWGDESDTFGPFQIVTFCMSFGNCCVARIKVLLLTEMWDWDVRADGWTFVSTWGSREPTVVWTVQLTADLAYIFLSWSIPSFTWLQAVTLAALLAALSAKDRVFTWWICAAIRRPGLPRWNWNVNAYWAAVNTCNPAGPKGGIKKAEEIETTQGGPLSTEVSCLCRWHQLLSSFNTKHHPSACHHYHPLGTKDFIGTKTATTTSLLS